MTQFDELKDRVSAKQKRLEARLIDLRADARSKGREDVKRVEDKLDAARRMISSGWENLTEDVAAKLNGWLEDDKDVAQEKPEAPGA